MFRNKTLPGFMSIAGLSLAFPATAQISSEQAPAGSENAEDFSGFVAIGPAVAPRYEGADQYRLVPFVAGQVQTGGVTLELQGAQIRADLVGDSALALGPILSLRLGRDDDDVSGPAGPLDEIDAAIEAGGFVGLRLGGDAYGQGQVQFDLTAIADVSNKHDGVLVSASAAYVAIQNRRFSFAVDGQLSWGDAAYTRTYFGITPAEAARSGLAAYRPGASLRDAGLGATIGYQFDRRWGVIGRLSWSYLLGDAADSPIVRDRGSRHQGVAGLAISYRF